MEILTLGEKIRRKRKSLRLTLKDVAGDSVTPAQLSYVESNKCRPSTGLLKFICSKIDLDINYVMESESEQAQKYCDYYMREYEFYTKRGQLEEAQDKLDKVEKLAENYGLDRYVGIVSYKKGENFLGQKDYDRAENVFLKALQIFMKLGYDEYEAYCFYNLGVIALERDYIDDALCFLTNSSGLADSVELSDDTILCKIHMAMAKTYFRSGRNRECCCSLLLAINEARNGNDRIRIAELLEEGALMISNSSDIQECSGYIDEAEKIYISCGMNNRVAFLSILRVLMYIKSGDFKAGTSYLTCVLNKIDDFSNVKYVKYMLEIADVLLLNGYDSHAKMIIHRMENIPDIKLNAVYFLLKLKLNMDSDINKTMDCLVQCLNGLEETHPDVVYIKALTTLGQLYKQENKYSEALEYFIKGAKLYAAVDVS